MKKGFSLVELSIVLVILGLLTGGILTGQNLIRAAELRALTTQMSQYRTALYTFRDTYFTVPGDMSNAEDFWGTDPDGCPTHTNWQTGKTQTCKGDGSGLGDSATERFRAWQQLAAAGMIEGSYSGVTGPDSSGTCVASDHEIGYNTPAGRVTNVGIGIASHGGDGLVASGEFTYWFEGDYRNTLLIGKNTTACEPIGAAFTPQETWNIDKKLDDGKPGTGKIVTRPGIGVSGHPNCNNGDNTQAASAIYTLSYEGTACGMYFRN
jgi:prepilin-type N-terminal cleavage/methylation domain-containing protein